MKRLLLLLAFAPALCCAQYSWNYFPPPNSTYDPTVPAMWIGGQLVLTQGSPLVQSEQTISFAPGLLSSVVGTKGGTVQFVKASTVDNMIVSSTSLVCLTNPTITLWNCGASTSCASPTSMGSATVTGTGTAFSGSLTSTVINAGDYLAWSISGGVCTTVAIQANAQVHSN